ncbi:hypothetical protein AB1Y20_010117 [Prymnesium parvum]|uniref:JmjC domain-containing protein n=1 Tax=Prymnesium parvum TaxID=97485 RepID=A0AB34K6B2_PRYPA
MSASGTSATHAHARAPASLTPFSALFAASLVAVGAILASRSYDRAPSLPRSAWPSGGAAQLARERRPALLFGSPSDVWPARALWNASYLKDQLRHQELVVWQQQPAADGAVFVYFADGGETGGGASGMRSPPCSEAAGGGAAARVKREVMRAGAFFDASPASRLYCSASLAKLGPVARDVAPLLPFAVAEVAGSDIDPIVWLGTAHVITQAHYDTSHNFFIQLVGRKRFWVWPPSSYNALRIFPSRHSLHRQSSLSSLPAAATAQPFEVTLSPGDVLYLPPFWFHHVEALDHFSVSVAVWSESAEAHRKELIDTLALPWEADWALERIAAAASAYVRSLLESVHHSTHAARQALRALVFRFEQLLQLPVGEQESLLEAPGDVVRLCLEPSVLRQSIGKVGDVRVPIAMEFDALRESMNSHVKQAVVRAAVAIRNVSNDLAVIHLVLDNYLEAVSHFVTGSTTQIYGYLKECCLRGW